MCWLRKSESCFCERVVVSKLEHKADVLVAEVGELLLRKGSGVNAIHTYRSRVGTVEGADDLQ